MPNSRAGGTVGTEVARSKCQQRPRVASIPIVETHSKTLHGFCFELISWVSSVGADSWNHH